MGDIATDMQSQLHLSIHHDNSLVWLPYPNILPLHSLGDLSIGNMKALSLWDILLCKRADICTNIAYTK